MVGATPRGPSIDSDCLVRCVEEVVISRVWNQRLLANVSGGRATRGGSQSTLGVQALNEGGIGEEFAAGRSNVIPDRLQQEAGNGIGVRAARIVAGRERTRRLRPNAAAVERTLPGRVTKSHRVRRISVGMSVRAQKMGDDLEVMSEEVRE